MDWLRGLIPGGGITAAIGAVIAVLGLALGLFKKAERSGYNKRVVEETKTREKNLKTIADAAGAKPTGSVHDDPHNRDNAK